jgi:hypothetical protein
LRSASIIAPADATLGERLELDASRFIEPVRCVDQADDTVLHEVPNIDRMGHRRCHATSQLLDERKMGNDARIFFALTLTRAHLCDLRRPA